MTPATTAADREVLIQRFFAAPPELVFRAWTDAESLKRWYAPTGCTTPFCSVDFRVGGIIHSCIRIPDGRECWCKGTYHEIEPSRRIVFSMAASDAAGNLTEESHPGADPEWPRETIVTVTFAQHEGGTRLTLHQTVSEALAKKTGAYPSWLQMFDQLDAFLVRE